MPDEEEDSASSPSTLKGGLRRASSSAVEWPAVWQARLACSVGANASCGADLQSASFYFDNRTTTLKQRLNSSQLTFWMVGQGSGRALFSFFAGDCEPPPPPPRPPPALTLLMTHASG